MAEAWKIRTDDGLTLEGEWAAPPEGTEPHAAVVLCHPHPLHGGTMRSIVISALFDALPAAGIAALRFNFRGVEGSEGEHGEGVGEQIDARAAVDTLLRATGGDLPFAVVGWSFGGDVTLASADPRARALVAIAPPLRFAARFTHLDHDDRPKLVILAEKDKVIDNAVPRDLSAQWPNTECVEIAGASHYFVSRTDNVTDAVLTFLSRVF